MFFLFFSFLFVPSHHANRTKFIFMLGICALKTINWCAVSCPAALPCLLRQSSQMAGWGQRSISPSAILPNELAIFILHPFGLGHLISSVM
jgi:hypothetical protein